MTITDDQHLQYAMNRAWGNAPIDEAQEAYGIVFNERFWAEQAEISSQRSKAHKERLSKGYVRDKLRQKGFNENHISAIPELEEIQTTQIKIHRVCKKRQQTLES